MAIEKASECLTLEQVEQFVTGKLDDLSIDWHVKSCPHCQIEVQHAREDNELFQQFADADVKIPESGSNSGSDGQAPAPATSPAHARSGQMIGRYKLLQKIGEGGFGEVWMAEQAEPIVRRVAVKIIKLGMDSKQVIARFEAERQALAMMDHPNIARVLDAGATDNGRPYFVMELVRGEPITTFCDKQKLPIRDRLDLFRSVCSAVQHAHQKGVIHRDIKPNNILVTEMEGRPLAHVIDFGIAKAMHFRLTEKTLFTEFRQFIGTPEYMSPEQTDPGGIDIDTRCDVYALGVLLYELLTGVTPLDADQLRSAAIAELQRLIREEEPVKPSTRLLTLATLDTAAANRKIETKSLPTLLRGDLDWIAMKCLEKDRNRRYDTANNVSEDIRRYLEGEPVSAGPPSAAYRLGKFARRNRGPVIAVAAIVLALMGGVIATTLMYRQVRGERDRAIQETAKSRRIQSLLENILRVDDPEVMMGRDLGVLKDMLESAVARCKPRLDEDPEVEAALRTVIAEAYMRLGYYDLAKPQVEIAMKLLGSKLEDEHPDVLRTRTSACELVFRQERREEYRNAEQTLRKILITQKRKLGENHPDTLRSMKLLGNILYRDNRPHEAENFLRQAYRIECRELGPEDPRILTTMGDLGNAVQPRNWREAEEIRLKALKMSERINGPEHQSTLKLMHSLAVFYFAGNESEKAFDMLEHVLRLQRRVLSDEHPDTIRTWTNLIRYLVGMSENARARPHIADRLAAYQRLAERSGANLQDVDSYAKGLLNSPFKDQRDPATAIAVAEKALGLGYRGDPHLLHTLALAYRENGEIDRAIETQREATARLTEADDPFRLQFERNMVEMLLSKGAFVAADQICRLNVEWCRQKLPEQKAELGLFLELLGLSLLRQERFSEAEAVLRERLDLRGSEGWGEGWRIPHTGSLIGACLCAQGRKEDAIPYLIKGYFYLIVQPNAPPALVDDALERLFQVNDCSAGSMAVMPTD